MLNLTKVLVGRKKMMSACAIAALFLFSGCGGSGGAGDSSANQDQNLGTVTSLEQMILSSSYAGKLVVHFDESLKIRLQQPAASTTPNLMRNTAKAAVLSNVAQTPKLVSLASGDTAVAPIAQVLAAHTTATLLRASDAAEDELDRQRAKLERLSGETMSDWNSVYYIKVDDQSEAVLMMRELAQTPGVTMVYPQLRGSPASLATTPSLTGLQGYLYDESTKGGLNAVAAWNAGVNGAGVYLFDNEPGINLDHEEFGFMKKALWEGGNYLDAPPCAPGFPEEGQDCPSFIAHGTAVAGIMIAKDNGHGITGFASDSHYVQTYDSASLGDLAESTNGIDDPSIHVDDDIEPGSIWVIEMQLPGKMSNGSCAGSSPSAEYGCVPVELWPDTFSVIKQATAYGITVVEGGGNGTMNLNDPNLYTGAWSFAKNLATEDAGAIMVGASEGADEKKISFSNCGTRFNSFAWGQGVVTTGYPASPYAWNGTTQPKPPNSDANSYFIDMFGGTSSAAAMVGGAAALVQSSARKDLGHKRYIMPLKMREIIVNSGVAQKDTSGCNIGKQPRVDVAMNLADQFIAQAKSQYPELNSGERLTDDRYVAMRQLGIGIICKEFDPVNSDPICPDGEIFPKLTKIAKGYDFDGDGRADLVKFENGKWYIDLSSKGSNGDNFGAWDVELDFPQINGKWVWPYVEDMDADGRSDLVAYDREHGIFYVAITDFAMLEKNEWHGWDWTLDYSAEWKDDLKMDPNQSKYSRPVIGKFNNTGWTTDGFNDIALICSDGKVRIDYGDGTKESFGNFEKTIELIPQNLLAQAPGWAYVPVPGDFDGDAKSVYIAFKVPDGLPDEGRMYLSPFDGDQILTQYDWMDGVPHMFGGNETIAFSGTLKKGYGPLIGVKEINSKWRVTADSSWLSLSEDPPAEVYGDAQCHPVLADFDGDGVLDRAVMCPNEWRIAYSGDTFSAQKGSDGVRRVPLGYDKKNFSLPGRAYYGGVSYEYTQQIIQWFKAAHPNEPPPIMVDMVTAASCGPGDC